MNEMPEIDIRPYASMSAMMSALNTLKLNNKEWSAADWGQVGDLTNISVKAPLLVEWIRLIKILKTVENYVKENDYRADRSGYTYKIKLVTDLFGDYVQDYHVQLEYYGNSITIHTNGFYIGPPSYKRKAYETVNEVYLPVNQLRDDLEDTTKKCFTWFFVWNLDEHTCPEDVLFSIFQNCRNIAESRY